MDQLLPCDEKLDGIASHASILNYGGSYMLEAALHAVHGHLFERIAQSPEVVALRPQTYLGAGLAMVMENVQSEATTAGRVFGREAVPAFTLYSRVCVTKLASPTAPQASMPFTDTPPFQQIICSSSHTWCRECG